MTSYFLHTHGLFDDVVFPTYTWSIYLTERSHWYSLLFSAQLRFWHRRWRYHSRR